MHKLDVEIIVAVDEDGGFGKDGKIPWHYSEDLKHFKEVTTGHVCIMGRKTYEDMLEMRKARDAKKENPPAIDAILPNRESFVVTRSNMDTPGATKARNLTEAIGHVMRDDPRKIFIIGGWRMYVEGLTWASRVHLTLVPGRFDCDKFFPVSVLNKNFKIIDGKQEGDLKFVTYARVR